MPLKIDRFKIGPFVYEPKELEIKSMPSYSEFQNVFSSGTDQGLGWYLSATISYWLYSVSDTIKDAVDRIADAWVEMPIKVRDKKTKEFIEHPAADLVANTDMRMNEGQLKKEMMISYLLTGECYPVLLGNVKFEPVGLFHYPAPNISIAQGTDGYIQTIIASYQSVIQTFQRAINPNFKTYVFETDNKLSQMMQIISVRHRNYLRAQSPLEGIYYQALTKYYGNIHNSSLVKNGARPGGAISPKTDIPQDQWENFKKEWKGGFESLNARGKTIVSPRAVEYVDFLLKTRDMDYVKMVETFRQEIYSAYQIPLGMVLTDAMTLNNYQYAIEFFYDQAALPRIRFILKNLGDFVLSRYKDGKDLEFCIDEKELPALKDRLYRRAKAMRDVGIFSQDEIRAEAGYDDLEDAEEGERTYISTTLQATGTDESSEYSDLDEYPDESELDENGKPIEPSVIEDSTAAGTSTSLTDKKPSPDAAISTGKPKA